MLQIHLALTASVLFLQSFSSTTCEKVSPSTMSPLSGNKRTLYQYFSDVENGGIRSGLVANNNRSFTLNGKEITILGGSLHYFRVHPMYWGDRLAKMRAAGLNSVDVYVPWNLHEPTEGQFDFGNGNSEFSKFLDIKHFLQLCQEHDLFVVLRPGPYICGEFEFGGLPSWLLSASKYPMSLRSSSPAYESAAFLYMQAVMDRVKDYQFFSTDLVSSGGGGGPIIAVQIENEFGAFGYSAYPRDKPHLRHIKATLETAGIQSLLFTSDGVLANEDYGHIENVLLTANFADDVEENLNALMKYQHNKPVFVTEFWSGWFDHWFEPWHEDRSLEKFSEGLDAIFARNGSVNLYMFHGGTSFGFMNGGNAITVLPYEAFDVSSYDYGAPLSECGNYTDKYDWLSERLTKVDPLSSILIRPDRPDFVEPIKYQDVVFNQYLSYHDMMQQVEATCSYAEPRSMETLDCLNGGGQSYGYMVYRKVLPALETGDKLKIRGRIHDLLIVMVNGVMVNHPILNLFDVAFKFGSWAVSDGELTLDLDGVPANRDGLFVLDLWVENLGRVNYGQPHVLNNQRKGIWEGPISINDVEIRDWTIFPLEFKEDWMMRLKGWLPYPTYESQQHGVAAGSAPILLKGTLTIEEDQLVTTTVAHEEGLTSRTLHPKDTFVDFSQAEWLHGIVFVNGFNIGRYFKPGPSKCLYIPGPLLTLGENEIIVVESYNSGQEKLTFSAHPHYGPRRNLTEEDPLDLLQKEFSVDQP